MGISSILEKNGARVLLLSLFAIFLFFLFGCPDRDGDDGNGGGGYCAAKTGYSFCGSCGNSCVYCPSGTYCSGSDACSATCKTSGGTSGGGTSGGGTSGGGGTVAKTYYASCSGCQGYYRTYSYRGASYGTCNAYYQACVLARCEKILDNCR